MKHVRNVTKLPVYAQDFEPGPIPIAIKLDLVTALLTALKPYLAAKFATTA